MEMEATLFISLGSDFIRVVSLKAFSTEILELVFRCSFVKVFAGVKTPLSVSRHKIVGVSDVRLVFTGFFLSYRFLRIGRRPSSAN
jgi:hypothetical protein